MDAFILDTNLFFNMEPGLGLGKKTEDVVIKVTKAAQAAAETKKVQFYMPPTIIAEFLGFFEDKEQPFLKEFQAQIRSKAPDIQGVQFPASVFYKIVEDIRGRSYRGLTISEDVVKNAIQELAGRKFEDKKSHEMAIGPFLKNLRERYRQATRTGFLDSVADLDLIVLAKELNGTLVSTDEGVTAWGREFGVAEMEASAFGSFLQGLLR